MLTLDTSGAVEGVQAFQQQAFDVMHRGVSDAFLAISNGSNNGPRFVTQI